MMNLDIIIDPYHHLPVVTAPPLALHTEEKPLLALIAEHYANLIETLHQYGIVLFRGFACLDADYFSNVIDLCRLGERCSTLDYDLPRTLLPKDIYTSSDLPASIPLPLHHEKPRSKNPPDHIYFCCITAPEKGGGTLFANAGAIWQDIPKRIQDKIIKHGVIYRQFFHGKSIKHFSITKALSLKSAQCWSDYFGTDERNQVEKKLTQDGIHWSWVNKQRDLVLSSHLPGALIHPITQQTCWFNSSSYLNYYSNLLYGNLKTLPFYKYLASRYLIFKDRLPMVCHYGDGQAFSSKDIADINRIIQHHSWVLNWQKGDFMIVDNVTYMHGKQAHQGNRLLYSCMTKGVVC